MDERRGTRPDWPAWLETLRPDELARARLRRRILAEGAPVLRARAPGVWDLASDWATLLAPVAAAVALVFAGMAVARAPEAELASATPAVEELVTPARGAVPTALARDSAADIEVVLAAIREPR